MRPDTECERGDPDALELGARELEDMLAALDSDRRELAALLAKVRARLGRLRTDSTDTTQRGN